MVKKVMMNYLDEKTQMNSKEEMEPILFVCHEDDRIIDVNSSEQEK
jgi:hypothetical protein